MWVLSKLRIKLLPMTQKSNFLGIQDRKALIQKEVCILLFTAVLSTIHKSCNQPRCPIKDERIMKKWFIYKMEYYIVLRNDVIIRFAAAKMVLEDIMLNEIRQKIKGLCSILFKCHIQNNCMMDCHGLKKVSQNLFFPRVSSKKEKYQSGEDKDRCETKGKGPREFRYV